MTMNFVRMLTIVAVSLILTSMCFAQEEKTIRSAAGNQYIISANAGGVNYVEGSVTVNRNDGTSGNLVKGDQLKVGERIRTESGSKTEILLNPGSYARLGNDAEFEFVTTDLDNLQLNLIRGSAIFEVYASDDFKVTVLTPGSRFYLIKSGVYRVDALEDGSSRIEVRNGKAQVGSLEAKTLKKARAAEVDGNDITLSKFKTKERDEFEEWSRDRAKDLAKANAGLQRKSLRDSLWHGYQSRRWDTFNSYGLWTYSSRIGGYCFLPFGYGWRSPYGFGLNRDLYYFRLPTVVYYVPRVTTRWYSGSGTNSRTVNSGSQTRRTIPAASGNGSETRRTFSGASSSGSPRVGWPSGQPGSTSPRIRNSTNERRAAPQRPVNTSPRSTNTRVRIRPRGQDQ